MTHFFNRLRRKKLLPPGKLIDVGGFKLHLHCTGPVDWQSGKSNPTVVIEAGCGWASPKYYWLQEKLSRRLQVCTYDRAGIGWSEASGQPHDAEHVATQLHTLLHKAGVKGPYLFAGHSIAGLYLRVYAGKYPQDVAGMALMDASHPRQKEVRGTRSNIPYRARLLYQSVSWCANMGLTALYNPLFNPNDTALQHLPEESIQQLLCLSHQPQTYTTGIAESDNFAISAQQALKSGGLGDLPLVVLTALEMNVPPDVVDKDKFKDDWLMLQQELASLSTQGRHKTIEGADHGSLITNKQYADQVADEILLLALS